MRARRLGAGLLLGLALAAPAHAFDPGAAYSSKGRNIAATGAIQLAFTPGDDAAGLILHAIRNATRQILVQAFSFTHRDIAGALIRASRRGVDVQVIADGEQTVKMERSVVQEIAAAGVAVYLDTEHGAAHNKVMVIDAGTANHLVITGSFNFTNAAQHRNAENLLLIRGNGKLTEAYQENWQRHREHAQAYR